MNKYINLSRIQYPNGQDDVIKTALERANVESIPYWQQDLGFKLIKMNEINFVYWNLTNSVNKVYQYLAKPCTEEAEGHYDKI